MHILEQIALVFLFMTAYSRCYDRMFAPNKTAEDAVLYGITVTLGYWLYYYFH
jgi:hypothetical protein